MATDEELRLLTEILFRRKFNPLDYVYTPEPIIVQSQDRQIWLNSVEERFRFLAADGVTVLRGKTDQISYRQILLQVCRYLKISHNQTFSTADLEVEIFLNLLDRAWKRLPASEQQVLTGELQRAFSELDLAKQLPPAYYKDPVGLMLKGGGALAVTSVLRPLILQMLARQFALHAATYQMAKQTVVQGGAAIATQLQSRAALQTAYRGMSLSAARYGAVRTLFTFLGPALWAWFFADLGWRAIATNYGRVIPVIFTLAQIRLTRTEWEPA
ncbi:MAG: YaaW family protein [Elainellaceae cyanobacterium]